MRADDAIGVLHFGLSKCPFGPGPGQVRTGARCEDKKQKQQRRQADMLDRPMMIIRPGAAGRGGRISGSNDPAACLLPASACPPNNTDPPTAAASRQRRHLPAESASATTSPHAAGDLNDPQTGDIRIA